MKSRRIPKHLQQSLFSCVVEFMSDSGLSESEIKSAFDVCLKKRRTKLLAESRRRGRYLQNGDLPADLLRTWHRDSRYIDANAKPRALPLVTGRTNVRQMALKLDPDADTDKLLRFMVSSGLLRETAKGRYLPANEVGAISSSNRFVNEHVAKSVIRFISTVGRNTKLASEAEQVIERFAYVSDLNYTDVQEFCEFTKAQGHSYLQVVDDWMEQRRLRPALRGKRAKKQGVVAGVHVIAYVGDGYAPGRKALLAAARMSGAQGGGSVRSSRLAASCRSSAA